ncbi:MAG TPA: HNH endonuclease family protein, partial [Bacteroidia bacterium]|nr:HNH endonuclease family protein [Bacteroidia bacterium]
YEICSKELVEKSNENGISIAEFADYLYKYVQILRVPLPDRIDLNHYFEIMNSRGEQLEKHEILKAKLMQCFNSFEKEQREKYFNCFNLIWEACSNMEKYVQYGFTTEQRHLIFGENNWNTISVYDFDELVNKLSPTLLNDANSVEQSIDEIINGNTILHKEEESDGNPERFNSVVNFQNFLLHVLRVQTAKDEVALDDKRLIDIFEEELPAKENEGIEFVKEFIYNLLKCKFLFDKYVIKREFTANTDRWSLKSLKWYSVGKVKNGVKYTNTFGEEQCESFDSDNRKVLMLLSMFHISIPSMSYKYWLNASLNYLFNQFEINGKDYISYLEHIAKSFVFDRYLAKQPSEYFPMIYENLNPVKRKFDKLDLNKLRYGSIENNLVFNFLDYLLWIHLKGTEKDSRVNSFEYTFRSSVEHYYPQTPINNDVDVIDDSYLHSFGNLCLISHEKNSRLNNHSPVAKKDHYGKSATLDSLKQFLMMNINHWTTDEIETHNKAMIELFSANLNSDFKLNGICCLC